MPLSKTFRVFISSTFSDMSAERDALQQHVFPRLRDLCMSYGCRFQAIDLRWGVSEEASLDQQTMRICLEELRRCQEITPRPNFLVLLGDRYGWQPLPEEIPADEYAAIERRISSEGLALLRTWYRRDDNARYRRDGHWRPGVWTIQSRAGRFNDYDHWEREVERPLREALREAVRGLDLGEEMRLKYDTAATHQEIEYGAMRVEEADGHVFTCVRRIANLYEVMASLPGGPAKDLVDTGADGRLHIAARRALLRLRRQLRTQAGKHRVECRAHWTGQGLTDEHIGELPPTLEECLPLLSPSHTIRNLCEAVFQALGRTIDAECVQLGSRDPLDLQLEAHDGFRRRRARFFVGRRDDLAAIQSYLAGQSRCPWVIWGESGSGKSTLLAKAVEEAASAEAPGEEYPRATVISRFLGITPDASNGRSLLDGLCEQIDRAYGQDRPVAAREYRDLVQEFSECLALATPEQPLILFLDALDQLSPADNAHMLAWLPTELPPHVRLVVSTLPGNGLGVLRSRLPPSDLRELGPMQANEGSELLDLWLQDAHRGLTQEQRRHIETRFSGCPRPLYLRLAFEEARHWRSWDSLPRGAGGETGLSQDVPGLLRDLISRLSQESRHGAVFASYTLAYLAAARHGLTEDELLDIISRDPEVLQSFFVRAHTIPSDTLGILKRVLGEAAPQSAAEEQGLLARLRTDPILCQTLIEGAEQQSAQLRLPIALWSRLRLDLEPYLTEHSADGTSLLAFFHRLVGDAVRRDCLLARAQACHQRLAGYFAKVWTEQDRAEAASPRVLSELPYQETLGHMWPELEATLCSPSFLEAKSRAGMLHDLHLDYDRAAQAGDLPAVAQMRQALLAAWPGLLARPQTLLQSLHNRLLWAGDREPRVEESLRAMGAELDRRGPWLETRAPLPGSRVSGAFRFPFEIVSSMQALSPKQEMAAVAAYDGRIEIRDVASGRVLEQRSLGIGRIVAIALSDAGTLAYADRRETLRVEGSPNSLPCRQRETQIAYHSACGVVAVDKDGALVAWQPAQGTTTPLVADLPVPVLALKVSADGRRILCLAGEEKQVLAVLEHTEDQWTRRIVPYSGPAAVDADLDALGDTVLLGCMDRQLRVMDSRTGTVVAQWAYEARQDTVITGAVERVALGQGESRGWAYCATRAGHVACWHWGQDTVTRLADYCTLAEPKPIGIFAVLELNGVLFLSTPELGSVLAQRSAQAASRQHLAAVSACLITPSGSIVSASEQGRSIRWYSNWGLQPLAQRALVAATAIGCADAADRIVVGDQQGWIWRQPPDEEVGSSDILMVFAERVTSLFEAQGGAIMAASPSGRVQCVHLPDTTELLRHASGHETLLKIQPAGRHGLFWSLRESVEAAESYQVISLATGVDEETEVLRTRLRLRDMAVSPDGEALCIVGPGVQVWQCQSGQWRATIERGTPAERAAFLGQDLLVVAMADEPWLEVWHVKEGLPTVGAIYLGERVSCLAAEGDRIVAGLISGDLVCMQLRGGSRPASMAIKGGTR